MRAVVMARGGVDPIPRRSTASPLRVCPKTTATVNTAMPSSPADSPCDSTKSAPDAPPMTIHHGIRPATRSSWMTRRPLRPGFEIARISSMRISPDPNEITEAT